MIGEQVDVRVDVHIVAIEPVGEGADALGGIGHDRTHALDTPVRKQLPDGRCRRNRADRFVGSAILARLTPDAAGTSVRSA